MSDFRWRATVYYRTASGTLDVTHDLVEIADIHDCIEAGPHWDTVERVEIVRVNHCSGDDLTIEAAEKL